MSFLISILSFVFVIFVVVLVHEVGHFCAGLLIKARIFEFNIGFGKKFASFKRKGIEYNLRVIPVGGSVNFGATYDTVGEVDPKYSLDSKDPSALENKSILQRIFVFLAGPMMNFILAIVIFFGLFASYGIPKLVVMSTEEGKPAAVAGMLANDIILSVDGHEVFTDIDFKDRIRNYDVSHEVAVLRENEKVLLSVKPFFDEEATTVRIGIGIAPALTKDLGFSNITSAVRYTWVQVTSTLKAVGRMITGKEKVQVSGPLGMADASGEAAKNAGFAGIIELIAIISISLGLVNLFPIPILDGGWVLLLIIQGIIGRKLPQKLELGLKVAGLAVILLLFVYATYSDVLRVFLGGVNAQ